MYHSLSFEDYCNGMVREENKSDGTVKVSGLSVVHSAMSSRNCYSFSLYHAKNGKEEYKTRNNSCPAGMQPYDKPVRSCLLYYSDGSVKSAPFEIDDEIKSAFIKLAEKYTKDKVCTQK